MLIRSGIDDVDEHLAVLDTHRVCADVLLAEHALTVVDAELPVVPLTREQLAVQITLRQAVPLMRTRIVERMDTAGTAHEQDPMAIGVHELHRSRPQVIEPGDGVSHGRSFSQVLASYIRLYLRPAAPLRQGTTSEIPLAWMR